MLEIALLIAWESWTLLGRMAPYLLLGFLAAGALSVCISPRLVALHLGGRGFGSVLKASLLGIPLPLCSCSVIPVSASLRRAGAGRAATASFLLSTPETGVDSIAVTYAMLGTVFAVYRPLMALAGGLLVGALVMLFAAGGNGHGPPGEIRPKCADNCHSGRGKDNAIIRAAKYGLVALPRDIGMQLLLGVVVAAAIAVLVPADQWREYLGGGIGGIILATALGVPVYVCATASVPFAVGLIHLGASPGAALAFMVSGPATNAATITTMWKFLGGRAMFVYLLTIAVSAIVGGLTLDWLFATLNFPPPAPVGPEEHVTDVWVSSAWAVLLLAIMAYSYLAKPDVKEWGEE